MASVGRSAGLGLAFGIGISLASVAAGVGAASGVGYSEVRGIGIAAGTSVASGIGDSEVCGVGIAAGVAVASGSGHSLASVSAGSGVASGVGSALFLSHGTAAGVSAAYGTTTDLYVTRGVASGVSVASGSGDGVFSVGYLLPPNAATFEKALSYALSNTLPVPIRQIMDANQSPAAFLPFLAAHESVDLWFPDWTDARKRAMIIEAPTLAQKKGTRQGSIRFLTYVDGTLVDAMAYPSRFVLGRAVIGRTPIDLPAFVARYLVEVDTVKPPRSLVLTRGALGDRRLKTPSRDKLNRCLIALRAAKAPETQIRVDFQYERMLTIADAPLLDGSHHLGEYIPRTNL